MRNKPEIPSKQEKLAKRKPSWSQIWRKVAWELKSALEWIPIPNKKDYLELKMGWKFVKEYMAKITRELEKYNPWDEIWIQAPEGYSISRQMLEFVAGLLRKNWWEVKVCFESSCMWERGYSYLTLK